MNEPVVVALNGWSLMGVGALVCVALLALLSVAVSAVAVVVDRLREAAARRNDRRAFVEAMRTGGGRVELLPPPPTFTPLGRPSGFIELPAGTTAEQAETFARAFARAGRRARRPRSMPSVAARRARRVHPR